MKRKELGTYLQDMTVDIYRGELNYIIYAFITPLLILSLCIVGCKRSKGDIYDIAYEVLTEPIPVSHGNLITITKAPEISQEDTLIIKWFGTASYEIRLGDVSVLTDPFVTYKRPDQILAKVPFKNYMESDSNIVNSTYGLINPPPNAVFIGHSHYDHMLDTVGALRINDVWNKVPVFGSKTAKHILAGYSKSGSPVDDDLCGEGSGHRSSQGTDGRWSENWCQADGSGSWKEVYPDKLFYKSFLAKHAPIIAQQIPWDGQHDQDLEGPPRLAKEFLKGDTYVYFFKLMSGNVQDEVSYTVGIVGAATDLPVGLEDFNDDLDILIICVPGWHKIDNYPLNLIRVLKPTIIILSHYDNFFDENYFDPNRGDEPIRLVPTSMLNEFLNMIQKDIDSIEGYDNFEAILIPGVGTTMYIN